MKRDQSVRYQIRFAESESDILAAQKLRKFIFYNQECGSDADRFDAYCEHVLISDTHTDKLVSTLRLRFFKAGEEISNSYSGQFYDLDNKNFAKHNCGEIGRFCILPGKDHASIVRMALGAITKFVDDHDIEFLFGCSSFEGIEFEKHAEALALLKDNYLAPTDWAPSAKAVEVIEFAKILKDKVPDVRIALKTMPPLLRSYLLLGGWVNNHAVIDRELNTMHIFTGLEINQISDARKNSLRMSVN